MAAIFILLPFAFIWSLLQQPLAGEALSENILSPNIKIY